MFQSKNTVKILLGLLIFPLILGLILQGTYRDVSTGSKNRIEIHFWNAMSGTTGVALNQLIADYNQSQDKYTVINDYEGAYGDTLSKYLSVSGTASSPDLVQVYDIGTQIMRNSKQYLPVQTMMNKDNYDKSTLEPRIADYYSLNGAQQSMPFNTSTPVMYYNKDLLASVGITKMPETYEDITALGQKLLQGDSKAKAVGEYVYGWIFEEMVANQGQLLINGTNGQQGIPTQSLANGAAGQAFMNWCQQMIKAKTAINYGTNGDVLTSAFLQGDVAIMFNSSASSSQIINQAKFNVGIGYMPHPANTERAGVTIGGASLYLANKRPADKTAGAWDFMKFASSPAEQAKWAVGTGYFPVNVNAYQQPILVAAYQKYPQMQVAVAQLQQSKKIPADSGFFSDTNTMARQTLETAMGQIYNGADVQTSLDKAADTITKALVLSKQAQGK